MHILTTLRDGKPNHWVTMKLKGSIKLKWPGIDAYHQGVMLTLEKPNDIRFGRRAFLSKNASKIKVKK